MEASILASLAEVRPVRWLPVRMSSISEPRDVVVLAIDHTKTSQCALEAIEPGARRSAPPG